MAADDWDERLLTQTDLLALQRGIAARPMRMPMTYRVSTIAKMLGVPRTAMPLSRAPTLPRPLFITDGQPSWTLLQIVRWVTTRRADRREIVWWPDDDPDLDQAQDEYARLTREEART